LQDRLLLYQIAPLQAAQTADRSSASNRERAGDRRRSPWLPQLLAGSTWPRSVEIRCRGLHECKLRREMTEFSGSTCVLQFATKPSWFLTALQLACAGRCALSEHAATFSKCFRTQAAMQHMHATREALLIQQTLPEPFLAALEVSAAAAPLHATYP
jgi:hypothetical protein